MILRKKKQQQEYDYLRIKVEKGKIGQIKSIHDLQQDKEKTFEDTVRELIDLGVSFRTNNFNLQNRELKIRTLDNMLLQIYPFWYETYQNSGIFVPISAKIVPFYIKIAQILYQKTPFLSEDVMEVIEIEAYRIFKYLKENFKDEYQDIKTFLRNSWRNKKVKALFEQTTTTKSENKCTNTILDGEMGIKQMKSKEKFKNGGTTKGKYKKDNGEYGEAEIVFPALSEE